MTATLNASNDDERPVPAIVAVLVDGFVPVYGLEAVSTSCTAPEAVEASVPIFHVTVPLVFEPPPVADVNDHPGGMTSVIVTPLAAPTPVLAYVRVYVTLPPAGLMLTLPSFWIDSCARAVFT